MATTSKLTSDEIKRKKISNICEGTDFYSGQVTTLL